VGIYTRYVTLLNENKSDRYIPVHELDNIDLKLLGVHFGELLKGEGPSVETGAETNATLGGVNADNTHGALVVTVGGDDDVHVFNNTLEGLEKFFLLKLQLEEGAVHLVHEKDRLDALSNSLTQHSLSLHAHTCQRVKMCHEIELGDGDFCKQV
jgi:hypothetical protein